MWAGGALRNSALRSRHCSPRGVTRTAPCRTHSILAARARVWVCLPASSAGDDCSSAALSRPDFGRRSRVHAKTCSFGEQPRILLSPGRPSPARSPLWRPHWVDNNWAAVRHPPRIPRPSATCPGDFIQTGLSMNFPYPSEIDIGFARCSPPRSPTVIATDQLPAASTLPSASSRPCYLHRPLYFNPWLAVPPHVFRAPHLHPLIVLAYHICDLANFWTHAE